jgi:tetratricopeptide (TPR) repeat protein
MRKLLPSFLVLVVAFPVLAQDFTPTIVVQNEGQPEPLGLVGLKVEARIIGYTAETTATMTFANPLARATEGDLYFPLPEGATVSGYALDIQGEMADGSVVEKQWARTVFETEKARRVDPGLVEWTKRDCFRTRVFPIPAQGRRTVRVQYVSELADGPHGATYRLPLSFTRPIPAFSLRVEVVKPASEPQVRQAAIANFRFMRCSDNFVAETKLENALLDKELIVALPDVEKQHVLVEKADDGHVYFAIHDLPPATAEDPPPLRPKYVVIYWDASGSRAGDHQREIGLLKALLAAWTVSSQPVRVDLVLLRNALSPPQRFVLSTRNLAKSLARVAEALNRIDYDGGTQLGALAPIGGERPDVSLLFSDGVSTFGRYEPESLGAPLYVFSAEPRSDWAVLHHLAGNNGGQCFDLAESSDAEIVAAMARPAYRPLPATVTGGQVSGLLPSTTGPVAGHFTLVGKLESRQATVKLCYHAAGQDLQERTFAIDAAAAVEGSLLRRLWAQKKLADLLIHEERNQAEIVALGKEFGLVTPYTSLMVLENLQQYLQYGIEPPKSLPALRNAYLQHGGSKLGSEHWRQAVADRQERAAKMVEVARLWQERVIWWATDWRHPKQFIYRQPARLTPWQVAPSGLGGSFGFGAPLGNSPQGAGGSGMGGSGMGIGGMGGGMGGMGGGFFGGMGGMPGAPLQPAGGPDPLSANGVQYSSKAFRHHRPPHIALQPCDPAVPYLKELFAAPSGQAFAVYMKNRAQYAQSPDFFLDCADYFFFHRQETDLAIQILSNLAELDPDDPALLRFLGHRLARAGAYDPAIDALDDVLRLRPNEPRSYRDLALVLAQRADAVRSAMIRHGKTSRRSPRDDGRGEGRSKADIRSDYARAVELFTTVVVRRWDSRFAEIELPALMELNRILPAAKVYGVKPHGLDSRLTKLLDLDLRIVMMCHADNTGMHLRVTEPSREEAGRDHNRTTIGGLVTRLSARDGPDEYLVRRAMNGEYAIQATRIGPAAPPGPVTVQVDIFTNFGRDNERHEVIVVRLKEKSDTIALGQVKF